MTGFKPELGNKPGSLTTTDTLEMNCTKGSLTLKHHVHAQFNTCSRRDSTKVGNGLLLSLFQVVFDLLITFSASVESSVIEMKPAAPVPVNNAVSL